MHLGGGQQKRVNGDARGVAGGAAGGGAGGGASQLGGAPVAKKSRRRVKIDDLIPSLDVNRARSGEGRVELDPTLGAQPVTPGVQTAAPEAKPATVGTAVVE